MKIHDSRFKIQEKIPIIILHGWKKEAKDYSAIQKIFERKGFTVYAIDLPGFGSEKLIKPVMVLDDYVDFVYQFIKRHRLKKVILLGHSFGGRVATKFTYQYPILVEKLILTGAPLIKRTLSLKKQVISLIAKAGKNTLGMLPETYQNLGRKVLYRSIGEWDYYKSGDLRETFKRIIQEDTSPILHTISVPTLLVWGTEDTFVPLTDGEEIHKRIRGSELISIAHKGHKLPYEDPEQFANAVLPFLR